jgi:Domain of unknown function (DUF4037)
MHGTIAFMRAFVPGRELARAFYAEVVGQLVGETPHSAAFVGTGSDVLGFDTERSTDHGWGPRLHVFVRAGDVERVRAAVDAGLPDEFAGWPVRYGWNDHPVTSHVVVTTLDEWLPAHLGFDPRRGVSTVDWLGAPQQILLEATSGPVFEDGLGELERVREELAWYPDDVWLWLLACQWRRIDQEEPFVGRTAEVGDELGSRILSARLARDAMRLCFLQERRYAPYSKWFGTAFARLDAHEALGERMRAFVSATDYETREARFVEVVHALATRHNALGVTAPVDESVGLFHDRPFRVLGSARFVDACLERVSDPWLRSLPLVGAIDQFVDSTDVLSENKVFPEVRALYERWQRS